ncbi:hypothetical protein PR202_ga28592 [Eleusine coracana subsp. coracana]|uniref:Uncharacterized protein n=1 Tax=Eleusine coracana subsp. coracana TaxID=191504 RepID=A0AAV5DIM0_ELECO|nr:hypothetical protein PR202_ga28592 [Eleusine coracana subsp. coracana]
MRRRRSPENEPTMAGTESNQGYIAKLEPEPGMKKWSSLLKKQDREKLEEKCETMKKWLEKARSRSKTGRNSEGVWIEQEWLEAWSAPEMHDTTENEKKGEGKTKQEGSVHSFLDLDTTAVTALTLKYLSHEAYWYFFKTLAFGNMDPEAHPKLVHLAMEITRIMNGSLLGANVTARLLRDNFDIRF